jgi:hypothetical protein
VAEKLGALIDLAGDDHKVHKAEHKERKADGKEKSRLRRIFAPFVFRLVSFVVKVELILFGCAREVNCGQQGR